LSFPLRKMPEPKADPTVAPVPPVTLFPITVTGNKVTGGTGATAGSAFGSGIFLSGNDNNNGGNLALITFAPSAGQTQAISDVIADQAGSGGLSGQFAVWGLTLNGPGTLTLSGANTFSGGVNVVTGTLAVNNTTGSGTGLGPVTLGTGTTLVGTGSIASSVTAQAGSFFAPGTGIASMAVGGNVIWNGTAEALYTLSNSSTGSSALTIAGTLTKSGSGAYVFNFQNTGAAPETYNLATFASTNFAATDFSYIGLPPGLKGTFVVTATKLQLTTAPATGLGTTGSAPVITGSSSASASENSSFSYTIVASNTPTSFAITGPLPSGLSLNSTTGVISGTPTQLGIFTITMGATNAFGSGSGTLQITVVAPQSHGGGGAPSAWFYVALTMVVALSQMLKRTKRDLA
jgi:autotransporter-associated beta strand protein